MEQHNYSLWAISPSSQHTCQVLPVWVDSYGDTKQATNLPADTNLTRSSVSLCICVLEGIKHVPLVDTSERIDNVKLLSLQKVDRKLGRSH